MGCFVLASTSFWVCLKIEIYGIHSNATSLIIEIHVIHKRYEIHMPKHRNPQHLGLYKRSFLRDRQLNVCHEICMCLVRTSRGGDRIQELVFKVAEGTGFGTAHFSDRHRCPKKL